MDNNDDGRDNMGEEDAPNFLEFAGYQVQAHKTAIYPGQGEALGLAYAAQGLAGGAGAVNNETKKCIRDDGISVTPERLSKIKHHLGETLWYIAAVCDEVGLDMEEVATENLMVLASRKDRGVLQGDGRDR